MSKYGVGVGEDFPVAENNSETPDAEGDFQKCGRGGREAWRRFRHKMRHRFHGHHGRDDMADMAAHVRAHHLHGLVVGGLALIGLAAILSALQSRR